MQDVLGALAPRKERMDGLQLDLGKLGERVTKLVLPWALLASLVVLIFKAGSAARSAQETQESVIALKATLMDPKNPVLRRDDLHGLSNQYATLNGTVNSLRDRVDNTSDETQAYINVLLREMVKRGIDVPEPPWETRARSVVIDGRKPKENQP